jgi:glycosyltransferase involved in cell wall biosynthesis
MKISPYTMHLFTSSFPYEKGEEFLEEEYLHLSRSFNKIIIYPANMGTKVRPISENTTICDDFATQWMAAKRLLLLGSIATSWKNPEFIKELKRSFGICRTSSVKTAYKIFWRLLMQHTYSSITCKLLLRNCKSKHHIAYTYWLGGQTIGAAKAARISGNLKVVSRAHHRDLYEETNVPAYIPFRNLALNSCDHICTITEHGHNLIRTLGVPEQNTSLCRLGVRDRRLAPYKEGNRTIRIVSCSYLVPQKQVDIMISGLKLTAERNKNIQWCWDHIGDGPQMVTLKQKAANYLSNLPNMRWKFHGHLRTNELSSFYLGNYVDIFLNTSRSEGMPVTIMEALSFGIPVVAPAIYGIPEVINDANGILMKPPITNEVVADSLTEVSLRLRNDAPGLRAKARETWSYYFQSEQNYMLFCDLLKSLPLICDESGPRR